MKSFAARITTILACASVLAIVGIPSAQFAAPSLLARNSGGGQKQKGAAANGTGKAAAAQAAVVPFHVGEQLEYRLSWATFLTAGTVRLSVVERRALYGWDAWHFRATGSSDSPLRTLFTIDDEFDSYTDTATFVSHQFESYLDELGRKEKTSWS